MRARKVFPVTAVACALMMGAPALAGVPQEPAHPPRVGVHQRLSPQTSDGVRGPVAAPVPFGVRAAQSTSDRVSWQVAPGVTYTTWDQTDVRGPIRAHLLTVDPAQPGVALDYAAQGPVRETAPVIDILRKDAAVAGVNGDFYDIGDTGAPLGLGRDRERGLLHARDSGWNASFYLDSRGVPRIGTLAMVARIAQHPELRVTNLNSPFVKPGGIGVYTHGWGRTAGYRVTEGQVHQVRMVVVREGRVQSSTKKLTTDKRVRGLVLIGRGDGAKRLRRLHVGSRADVSWWLDPQPQMAISGNRFLVDDGLIKVTDDRELQPRTAVGIDDDTGEVLILAVDGRTKASRGYTMVELADLMIDLGADEALNLDGGGSTTMVARRPNGRVGVLNTPSDGFQRSVANALEVTYAPPK
ncbi:MAG: Exopolysaccharide biosynthesis protein-like protein [Nocardioides sp.]|nr:Exopolysaccharide biosynthesis protein-like protein [Nocardioides sp.]